MKEKSEMIVRSKPIERTGGWVGGWVVCNVDGLIKRQIDGLIAMLHNACMHGSIKCFMWHGSKYGWKHACIAYPRMIPTPRGY